MVAEKVGKAPSSRVKKVLIINGFGKTAYQGEKERAMLEEYGACNGRLTETLVEAGHDYLGQFFDVTLTDVAQENLDIAHEQRLFFEADYIIWHLPVYWYNVPAATKYYLDLLLEMTQFLRSDRKDPPPLPYGKAGLLQGRYLFVYTFAAEESVFEEGNFLAGLTADDLFLGTHKTMEFIGLSALPSYAIYGVNEGLNIPIEIHHYIEHLADLFKLPS